MALSSFLWSDDGLTWNASTSNPFDGVGSTAKGFSVRWANFVDPSANTVQRFIAVCENGVTNSELVTSTDGKTWVAGVGVTGHTLLSPIGAIKDGSTVGAGGFGLILANAGSVPNRGSNNGTTWSAITVPAGGLSLNTDREIIWGGGLWLLGAGTGGGGATTPLWTAATTWTTFTIQSTAADIGAVFYDGTGQYAATGDNGSATNPEVITSPTTAVWTPRVNANGTIAHPLVLAYSPSLGMWLCAGGSTLADSTGTGGFTLLRSTNAGATWTGSSPFPGPATAIVWSSAHNLFVAVGNDTWVSTSSDGVSWSNATLPFSATTALDVDVSPQLGRFVIACVYTTPVVTGGWLLGHPSASTAPPTAWHNATAS